MHRQPAHVRAYALLLGFVCMIGCQSETVKPSAEEPVALDTFFDPAVIQTIVLDIAPADRQARRQARRPASYRVSVGGKIRFENVTFWVFSGSSTSS